MKKLMLLAGGAFLLNVILAAAIYFVTRDAPSADDADLLVERPEILDEDNAFCDFLLARDVLYWPEDKPDQKRAYAALSGDSWDEEFVVGLLERNAEALAHFADGLGRSGCRVPAAVLADEETPYLLPLRRIADQARLRCKWLFKHGEERQAFDTAMDIVRFGHMLVDSGDIIQYTIGQAVKRMGLTELREMAAIANLRPKALAAYAEEVGAYRADGAALANSLRAYYLWTADLVDGVASGRITPDDLPSAQSAVLAGGYKGYLFQPNRTRRIFAAAVRVMIADAPGVYADRRPVPQPEGMNELGLIMMTRLVVSGNAIGKIMAHFAIPSLATMQTAKCKESVDVDSTRLLLAIRAYSLETGDLPETLEQLVPKYLTEVPLDDFDGKPMRYSKEDKVIYSIGDDLVDSGGKEPKYYGDKGEPTVRIEF